MILQLIKGAKQCGLERLETGKVVTMYKPTVALTVPIPLG